MATLPIFIAELHIIRHGLGIHEKQVKGYPDIPVTLGHHLRKRRLDLGLTQREVSARFGVSPTPYNYWEANRFKPRVDKWPEIIRFLGYDPRPVG